MDDLYPRGTRYISEGKGYTKYLIETPPKVIDLNFLEGNRWYINPATYNKVRVVLPWQYFVIKAKDLLSYGLDISDSRVFWSPVQIHSLDVELIPARLPNVNVGSPDDPYKHYRSSSTSSYKAEIGNICWGSSFSHYGNVLEEAILYFFSSRFNSNRAGWNLPSKYRTLQDWQADTTKDPDCFLSWKDWEDKVKVSLASLFSL